MSIVGPPGLSDEPIRVPDALASFPILLPSRDSEVRLAFDQIVELAEIRPNILAEIDDMAMLRLFARDSHCLALVPPVVVRDELIQEALIEYCKIPQITESFYAISQRRRVPNPLVREVLERTLEEPTWATSADELT